MNTRHIAAVTVLLAAAAVPVANAHRDDSKRARGLPWGRLRFLDNLKANTGPYTTEG